MVGWVVNTVYNTYIRIPKFISNLSIFYKMFYGISIILFFVIAISSFVFDLYSINIYRNEVVKNSLALVEAINTSFEDNLDQVDKIISTIYSDDDRKNLISTKYNADVTEEYNNLVTMRNFFNELVYLRKDFNNIYLYISEQKSYSYSSNGAEKENYIPIQDDWYKKTVEADGKTVIFPPHAPFQLNGGGSVISFSRMLKYLTDKPYGVVLLDFSSDLLNNIVEKANLNPDTNVIFLDSDGKSVYSNAVATERGLLTQTAKQKILKQKGTGKFTISISGNRYLFAFTESKVTGWMIVTITPYSAITKDGEKLFVFSLVLAGIGLLLAIVLSYILSSFIFNPIKRLKEGMTNVKEGDFDLQLETVSNDEVGRLITSFNTMVSTIKSLIREKYEEKIARKDAEFKYLQAQINPHYIYNSLQAISSMAVVKKAFDINNAAVNLAKTLRYSISNKSSIVRIDDEIQNVLSYLEVQKLRFNELIEWEINISEEIKEYGIIKLSFQPLVENSIVHGLERSGCRGIIKITADIIDNELHIKVFDNGAGIPEAEIRNIINDLNTDSDEKNDSGYLHNSIGLKNINKRIKLIYGGKYGINIKSMENEWTSVELIIPAVKVP